jgi:iron(II)-dependent oxidoreductase
MTVDPEGRIPAPDHKAVLISLPALDPDGRVTGHWAVLVGGGPWEQPTFNLWLIDRYWGNVDLSLHWFPVEAEPVAALGLDSQLYVFERSDDYTPTLRLRTEGDRLVEVCWPTRQNTRRPPDGACQTLIGSSAEEAAGSRPFLSSGEGYADDYSRERHLTLRDLDGDGEPELAQILLTHTVSRRDEDRDTHQLLFGLEWAESSTALQPVRLEEQPLWIEVLQLLASPSSEPPTRIRELTLIMLRLERLRWSSREYDLELTDRFDCVEHRATETLVGLLTESAGVVSAWRHMAHLPRQWSSPDYRVYFPRLSVNRVESEVDERRLFYVGLLGPDPAPVEYLVWDASNNPVVEVLGPEGPHLVDNPSGTYRMGCQTAQDDRVTLSACADIDCAGMLGGRFIYTRLYCACETDISLNAAGLSDWERIAASEDPEAVYSATFEIPSTDGHRNLHDREVCENGRGRWPGLGFVGWLSDSEVLYAADRQLYRLSMTDETFEPMDVTEVSPELRAWAGVTDDGRYRYMLTDEAWSGAQWRVDLQSGEVLLLDGLVTDPGIRGDHERRALRVLASPGSYVVPSPDGARIAVITGGVVRGIWDVPNATLSSGETVVEETEEALRWIHYLSLRPDDSMPFVRLEGGTFTLGIGDDELEAQRSACRDSGSSRCSERRFRRERPELEVSVGGFFLDRFEVSRRQYELCVAAGGCAAVDESECAIFDGEDWGRGRELRGDALQGDAPRTCVTRAEAESYCGWVEARLPTEAEWEWAAAGEERRIFPWGDDWDEERVVFLRGGTATLEPASARPLGSTPEGIQHLAGNAYEWVADGAYDYSEYPPEQDSGGAGDEAEGIVRGGSFASDGGGVRTTYRRFQNLSSRVDSTGFRCAMDSAQVSSEPAMESLRERIGLPEDTPIGDVEWEGAALWASISHGGGAVRLVDLERRSRRSECASGEEPLDGSFWLFPSPIPVALQLRDRVYVWYLDPIQSCLVRSRVSLRALGSPPAAQEITYEVVYDEPPRGSFTPTGDVQLAWRDHTLLLDIGRRGVSLYRDEELIDSYFTDSEMHSSWEIQRLYWSDEQTLVSVVSWSYSDGNGCEHATDEVVAAVWDIEQGEMEIAYQSSEQEQWCGRYDDELGDELRRPPVPDDSSECRTAPTDTLLEEDRHESSSSVSVQLPTGHLVGRYSYYERSAVEIDPHSGCAVQSQGVRRSWSWILHIDEVQELDLGSGEPDMDETTNNVLFYPRE